MSTMGSMASSHCTMSQHRDRHADAEARDERPCRASDRSVRMIASADRATLHGCLTDPSAGTRAVRAAASPQPVVMTQPGGPRR